MIPADDPPLFLPGWEVEPCDTAQPPATARRRYWADDPDPPDAVINGRPAYNVAIPIDQYPEGAETCQPSRRPSSSCSSSPTVPNVAP